NNVVIRIIYDAATNLGDDTVFTASPAHALCQTRKYSGYSRRLKNELIDLANVYASLKLVIADGVVVTGSFNLSNHAMGNAENVLLIGDPGTSPSHFLSSRRNGCLFSTVGSLNVDRGSRTQVIEVVIDPCLHSLPPQRAEPTGQRAYTFV